MNPKIKIALADDEILIRKGIRTILEQEDNFEVVFEASNGQELLHYLENGASFPEIILMDIRMPELNGIDTTKKIVELYPDLKIIALSSYTSDTFMAKILEVGAVCYITKSTSPSKMIAHINLVIENGFYYEENMMQYVSNNFYRRDFYLKKEPLSDREIEILQLICQQLSATEIGVKLGISPRTVDGHRNNLLLKTESKNIIGLVLFAVENKIYLPE